MSWGVAPCGEQEAFHVRWGRLHVVVRNYAFGQRRIQGWLETSGLMVDVLNEW